MAVPCVLTFHDSKQYLLYPHSLGNDGNGSAAGHPSFGSVQCKPPPKGSAVLPEANGGRKTSAANTPEKCPNGQELLDHCALRRDQEATNIHQESTSTNKGNDRLRTEITRCDGNRRRFARLQKLPPSRQATSNNQAVFIAKSCHRQKRRFGGVSVKDERVFS